MSRLMGNELPRDLVTRLSGENVSNHAGKVVVLLSVDEKGWAHPAMFSYYEIVATGASTLRLAIGGKSTSAANLKRNGKATIIFTEKDSNYYVKANAKLERESLETVPSEGMFALRVEQVSEDLEPQAPFLNGPMVGMPNEGEVVEFTRKILAELKRPA